jgi:hypothetical protein
VVAEQSRSTAPLAATRTRTLSAPVMTTKVVAVEVLPAARKHGISDDDIRHAVTNALAAITTPERPDVTMLIGPDRTTRLLEIGILAADDNDYVIHAMPARPKYLNLIEPRRGDQR